MHGVQWDAQFVQLNPKRLGAPAQQRELVGANAVLAPRLGREHHHRVHGTLARRRGEQRGVVGGAQAEEEAHPESRRVRTVGPSTYYQAGQVISVWAARSRQEDLHCARLLGGGLTSIALLSSRVLLALVFLSYSLTALLASVFCVALLHLY